MWPWSPYLPLRAQPLFCYVLRLSEKCQKVKLEMRIKRTLFMWPSSHGLHFVIVVRGERTLLVLEFVDGPLGYTMKHILCVSDRLCLLLSIELPNVGAPNHRLRNSPLDCDGLDHYDHFLSFFLYVYRLSWSGPKVKSKHGHIGHYLCDLPHTDCTYGLVRLRLGFRRHHRHKPLCHHSSHPWGAVCILYHRGYKHRRYPSDTHLTAPVVTHEAVRVFVFDATIFGDKHVLPFSLLLLQPYHRYRLVSSPEGVILITFW